MTRHLRALPDPDELGPEDVAGDVMVDVDGDGIPDRVSAGAVAELEQAVETSPTPAAGREVALRADEALVPVDRPTGPRVFASVLSGIEEGAKPILPAWLRDRRTFRSTVRRAALMAWHVAAWHGVRLVPHALILVGLRAPRGLHRGAGAVRRWVADTETAALQREAVRRGDHEAARIHMALTRQRRNRAAWRWSVLGAAAVAAAGAAIALRSSAPGWASWLAVAGVLLALGRIGTDPDQALFGHAVVKAEAPKLTSVVVVMALQGLGIAALSPARNRPAEIRFLGEIARDGDGYRAEVDLPIGVTALEVIDRRDTLSANLRRPLGCVWPEPVLEAHPGRLALYVADQDPAKKGPVKWALRDKGATSYFGTFHFGDSAKGRPIDVGLFEQNLLVGSIPGQGKTAAARVIVGGVSLDALVELWLHELKGSGDLKPWEQVAHRYVSGITDEAVGYAAHSLALLRKEVMRRTGALQEVPEAERPDNKLTPEIAATRRYNLRPLVCVIDECQNLFSHDEFGKQAGKDAEFIIKIGRAFGVTLVLLTQRPDAKSLPQSISDNVSLRFCLAVAGQVANDMILGTSSYKDGLRSTMFRPKIDAGTGWLKGAGPEPVVVRTAYLDGPASQKVAERAYLLRKAAGTLTGHAAGVAPEEPADAYRVVVDVLRVWTPGEDAMWSETVAAKLAELEPARYAALEDPKNGARILGDQLRALGVEVKDRHRKVGQDGSDRTKGVTRKGVALEDLERLLRDQGRTTTPPAITAEPTEPGDNGE